MNEITPLSQRVFDDGPDESAAKAPASNWLLGIVALLAVWAIFTLGAWSQNHAPQPPPTGYYQTAVRQAPGRVLVHVAGAVKKPGVYTLPATARVNDAVQRALPLTSADVNALNLAAWAEDGSRIEVPLRDTKKTVPVTAAAELITLATPPVEKLSPHPTSTPNSVTTATAPSAERKAVPARKININKAALDELTELPGIGPAMAQRILDYRRENGSFSAVDELDEVKGIGPKKLEKLRPYATVR